MACRPPLARSAGRLARAATGTFPYGEGVTRRPLRCRAASSRPALRGTAGIRPRPRLAAALATITVPAAVLLAAPVPRPALATGLLHGRPPAAVPARAHATTVPAAAPVVQAAVPLAAAAAGSPPVLRWPSAGQGAVLVDGVGLLAASPGETPVPIASLTKLMTVDVLLHDHPLSLGQPGPSIEMTAADVADWRRTVAEDGSNVEVRAGEQLSELQLLEALLLPSADNLADTAAIWDAGSQAAFVARMNATAAALGLTATHYADTSGLDPASRSDAVDQARLAAVLLANPVVRAIVRQPSLPFPVVGRIPNLNPALGVDGIVALKSGLTDAAGGCLVAAAWRSVGGQQALVVTVALGQPDQLAGAARAGEALLAEAGPELRAIPVTAPRQLAAWWWAPWRPLPLPLRAPVRPLDVVGWPGLRLTVTVDPSSLVTALDTGPAATLVVRGPSGPLAAEPLTAG